jgi:radical SAM superfamily enzyme YgiQ (UPF0313 family)
MKRFLLVNPPVLCVNDCQKEWYSFAHPTSLLKIAAFLHVRGNEVDFIDCMAYEDEWGRPLTFYRKMPLGTGDLGLEIDTYLLGKSLESLEQELKACNRPDEIWVSCHLTFNSGLAHATIAVLKRSFPGVPVVFGGNYPTLFPEEAARSGAVVHRGRLQEASMFFPDYSVFQKPPDYIVFQLTLGCGNRCSHCVNHLLGPVIRFDADAVVEDIRSKRRTYQTRTFVNIDPNIDGPDMACFLQKIMQRRVDVDLYFFGGIQPDRVTPELVRLMKQANVKGISLPRELNRPLNARLKKQYGPEDFTGAIRLFEKEGFDLSAFHCPFPVGLRDEELSEIVSIIGEIKETGAVAEIAPISFIPGTLEYERHIDLLKEKNLGELNWALWPTLDSKEKIRTYALTYNMAHNFRFADPWALAEG